ncbi:predicted protein [Arabidopsis lyrata subsp. lyrata]|uniref:Predicted protein n=1 Tax=Arabidopsis lyrata subsp. lyrata TaxID=81972 RepID=D7MPY0_ARALL|nr:predicted protein [Arabidopsis lyrata subsp. lyrata]
MGTKWADRKLIPAPEQCIGTWRMTGSRGFFTNAGGNKVNSFVAGVRNRFCGRKSGESNRPESDLINPVRRSTLTAASKTVAQAEPRRLLRTKHDSQHLPSTSVAPAAPPMHRVDLRPSSVGDKICSPPLLPAPPKTCMKNDGGGEATSQRRREAGEGGSSRRRRLSLKSLDLEELRERRERMCPK